ncbi:FMN-binding negative transcriptional regulator [Solimonas terrae]|uniref:FMN-binding negative transcriptional regulator n=1 Tax=Solimonas terrae TaxID=1396819 RepID=A0A6M2BWT6_9GAMM|nr:FMN-binding negative transcriptional regulator [Solimonas terrae]NGY06651.1 FMN-binding negative transcriptional regulator [Solimonas terrae]
MSLYTPPSFAGGDRAAALRLIADRPFATLVTGVDGEEPHITHLPLLHDGEQLSGHMARANPHWRCFERGQTVAIFHGPHAYVSPRWYETPAGHVPTWNYAVVHVAGRPVLLEAEDARRTIGELSARFDPDFTAGARRLDQLLPSIVAFRMPIARLDAKFKMNQNRSSADRDGVIAALAASAVESDREVADWMRHHD